MIGMALGAVLFAAIGLLMGVGYRRGVVESMRHYQQTGERARPVVMHVYRLLLLALGLGVIRKAGTVALLATLLGFFVGRVLYDRFGDKKLPPRDPGR
jgi:hypothetical protein